MSSPFRTLWEYLSSALTSEAFFAIASIASVIPIACAILKYIYRPLRIHYSPSRLQVLQDERSYLQRVILQMDRLDRATYWEDLFYTPLEADMRPLYLIPPEFLVLRQKRSVKAMELAPSDGEQRKYSDILTVFRKFKEPLVVLGDPGAGKSVSFRHALRDIATGQQKWYQTKPFLPVYIPCGHYTDTKNGAPVPIEEFLANYLQNTFPPSEQGNWDFKKYLTEGRLVLFFDALDEMPRNDYSERIKLLRQFAEKFFNNRILFSCRRIDYDKRLQVTEVSIRPFDRDRRRKFLTKALARNFGRKKVNEFIYQLETDPQTAELLNNPFFCQLVVFFIIATQSLPTNRYQLFSLYIKQRLITESQRTSEFGASVESVTRVLSSLAYLMSEAKGLGTAVTSTEVAELLDNESLLETSKVIEISLKAKLLIKSDNDLLQFAHHRLQEYFAALFATNNTKWTAELVPKFCDDIWWREILIMMMGMGEHQDQKIATIIQTTLNECREKFGLTLDSLEEIIGETHAQDYQLSFSEDLDQKVAYLEDHLAVFDPYADDKEVLQNLLLTERICDGDPIPYTQRKRLVDKERSTDGNSNWRDWIKHLEELLKLRRNLELQIYLDVMTKVRANLNTKKDDFRSLRQLVVNRIGLALACATNSELNANADTWLSLKQTALTILQRGTPIEQVKIAKEIVVRDNDADVARDLRLLLTSKSNWVAGQVFAALLSFRIPHVGYDWRSIRYLWNEIDRQGMPNMLREYVPALLKSFVRTKSLLLVTGLCAFHLGYVVLVSGVIPFAAYLVTTLDVRADYLGWPLIIKESIVHQVCIWTAGVLLVAAFALRDIRAWATVIGSTLVVFIFLITSFINDQFHQSNQSLGAYLQSTAETSTVESSTGQYVIIGILALFILGKIIPFLLGYAFYLIQVIRLRRFRRTWEGKQDQRLVPLEAVKYYKTFNSERSKVLIIDFLWNTADFDKDLINKLTELANEEKSTQLSDRLWNLINELEARQRRAA